MTTSARFMQPIEDLPPLPASIRSAATRYVRSQALSDVEAHEFLAALGLVEVDRPKSTVRDGYGVVRSAAARGAR